MPSENPLEKPSPSAPESTQLPDALQLSVSLDQENLPASIQPTPPPPVQDQPEVREATRRQLAQWMLGIYCATNIAVLIVAGTGYFRKPDDPQITNLLTLLITSQTTLVGTALGFYFGDRSSQ